MCVCVCVCGWGGGGGGGGGGGDNVVNHKCLVGRKINKCTDYSLAGEASHLYV